MTNSGRDVLKSVAEQFLLRVLCNVRYSEKLQPLQNPNFAKVSILPEDIHRGICATQEFRRFGKLTNLI